MEWNETHNKIIQLKFPAVAFWYDREAMAAVAVVFSRQCRTVFTFQWSIHQVCCGDSDIECVSFSHSSCFGWQARCSVYFTPRSCCYFFVPLPLLLPLLSCLLSMSYDKFQVENVIWNRAVIDIVYHTGFTLAWWLCTNSCERFILGENVTIQWQCR